MELIFEKFVWVGQKKTGVDMPNCRGDSVLFFWGRNSNFKPE